jgi:hypothetical protein
MRVLSTRALDEFGKSAAFGVAMRRVSTQPRPNAVLRIFRKRTFEARHEQRFALGDRRRTRGGVRKFNRQAVVHEIVLAQPASSAMLKSATCKEGRAAVHAATMTWPF